MFTGLVQAVGNVRSIKAGRLILSCPTEWAPDPGESIAVNGVCLTALPESPESQLWFDLSPETLSRTSLNQLIEGSRVNLERALRVGQALGGHIVQGHVDTVGRVEGIRDDGNSKTFTFQAPEGYAKYLIDKGSVSIDGVSLTVIQSASDLTHSHRFDVAVIPHTLQNTNLGDRKPGDKVNLEFDVLAKHVEKLLQASLFRLESSSSQELP